MEGTQRKFFFYPMRAGKPRRRRWGGGGGVRTRPDSSGENIGYKGVLTIHHSQNCDQNLEIANIG